MRDRSASKAYWDNLYETRTEPMRFGQDDITYQLGADFIGELAVEDWGCGLGWFRKFARGPYRGIDGSPSMYADDVVDLREYRSETPALYMRHVLEHNPFDWRLILDNAVASFTKRMVLVLFTPTSDLTILLRDGDPPDVSLSWNDLTGRFGDLNWHSQRLSTATQYSVENIFYLEKP